MERKGVEPSTSALRTHDSTVLSDSLSEVAATIEYRCTNGCTSETGIHPEAASIPGSAPGNSIGTSDFAAALAMIAGLPLSDVEKAQAVRRLLAGQEGTL